MTSQFNGADRRRQIVVTLAEVACILGTLVGTGVLGTAVESSSGGALAADATLLAPAGPAFSIWSVIYLGLAVYTVWQWFPSVAVRPRVRATGYLIALSMVLNAAWLLVTQQGWIWVSVAVIVALALTLVRIARLLASGRANSLAERVILDGTTGLYLGWVSVATFANIAAAGASSGISLPIPAVMATAALVLVVLVAGGISVAVGGRLSVAVAMVWGLSWLAIGRLTDEPSSTLVGVAALVAAVAVVAATVAGGRRRASAASA